MKRFGEVPGSTYTIGGHVYPALLVGKHDGEPYARLPMENGLVVEAFGWRDGDEASLFLIDESLEESEEDPNLCWSGVVTADIAVATIAAWSHWTRQQARSWYEAHVHRADE